MLVPWVEGLAMWGGSMGFRSEVCVGGRVLGALRQFFENAILPPLL